MIESQEHLLGNWVYRVRVPSGAGPHPVMFLLHGWKGDETVMWVFAGKVPSRYLIIAPRAIHAAPDGGYGWVDRRSNAFSRLEDFRPAVEALAEFAGQAASRYNGDPAGVDLMGFSQGAALAFSWAATRANQVRSVAGLAGFVPEGLESLIGQRPLAGKKIFVGHGSHDPLVPVALIHHGREVLAAAGAEVVYCEDAVGHKLSAGCMRALGEFYQEG